MTAFETASCLPDRPTLGVLRRGIAGVHRRIECGGIQHSSGIGLVVAECVSVAAMSGLEVSCRLPLVIC